MSMQAVVGLARFEESCARILQLKDALEEATRQRDAALLEIHEGGIPKCHVGAVVRNYLQTGWSPADIRRLGLSDGSIRLALDRSAAVEAPDGSPRPDHLSPAGT